MTLKASDKKFWQRVLDLAKENIPQRTFDYFYSDAKLIEVKGDQAKILVSSPFHKTYWKGQDDLINTASLDVYGGFLKYALFTREELSEKDFKLLNGNQEEILEGVSEHSINLVPYNFPNNLQKKYNFDNFIEGDQNKMALAACVAITDSPGEMYNPLFIWGGPGLGKTHLLHAIGNEFTLKRPRAHVLYVSSESFVTDYVNATRKKQMETFIEKYRNLDLLLIDDVQFFSDKEGTINEFFSTFNDLHDKGAQIVITSDRSPSELNQLPERLVSRFQWGLPTNISAPDIETRMGILMNKVERTGLEFPPETIRYIASQVNSNVRELEGVLNQVEFAAKMQKLSVVALSVAEKVLESMKSATDNKKRLNLSIGKIKEEVARYYHIPISDIISPKRLKDITYARQTAMYLIRELLGTSLPAIGNEFGNRDHTTVMYAVKVITDKLKSDDTTQRDIDSLKRKLNA